MNNDTSQTLDEFREQVESGAEDMHTQIPEAEVLEITSYPEDNDEGAADDSLEEEIESLVQAAHAQMAVSVPQKSAPAGYVSNARNAGSNSDTFQFWAPAEETVLGIGNLVRHVSNNPATQKTVDTIGIITETGGFTLGLDDYAIHVYEQDAHPPLDSITPVPSRRRPVVDYKAKVVACTERTERPVLSGPVYALRAAELAQVHGRDPEWPDTDHILLGFYEDSEGKYGIFSEERARVLGPKQGHVIFSGLPGAGKTSLFLTLVISMYAQLRELAGNGNDECVPKVATLAVNAKGADLLFVDHLDSSELENHDLEMWRAARVDMKKRPFGRVIVYVPLADDGLNRNSLRTNQKTDQEGYSETREFALGIQDLWPYLDLFFEKRSGPASDLLAEVERYLASGGEGFSLAEVLNLFQTEINLPKKERAGGQWENFTLGTIRAVQQRLSALPVTLGGLVDITGTGFGLDRLTNLGPYDMVVIDFERIMANPRDPGIAENAIKIITAYVINRLTEAMTVGKAEVDHVVVFADELNRLAPRQSGGGIGEYLAQIARTTRDRGIVLFGAGQYRSGINEDILKSASVHYSMQTPDYELSDRIYKNLTAEFKVRLTQLMPGETLLQYPSLRTAVFARFPRPFVLAGALKWREKLPPAEPQPVADCIAERLCRLDPDRPPQVDEVRQLLSQVDIDSSERSREIVQVLRNIEMERAVFDQSTSQRTPWEQFSEAIKEKFSQSGVGGNPTPVPSHFMDDEEGWDD